MRIRPYVSSERAELLTDFYQSGEPEKHSVPVARAMAFRYLVEHRTIYIGDGELIVGERGQGPKATPTYPELCCHSMEDLEILASRQRTRFEVSEHVRRVYRDRIIPFWKGRSIREKLFGGMTEAWRTAFDAGVFTEFMEQRSFGHAILDDKIYRRGFLDFKRQIAEVRSRLDWFADARAYEKDQELSAMDICA
ncbi:MAG: formate C-acetyltransferase/glycerol dehydratase family glycyl radical enzyme, partial [Planctomycetes bacterium]|nr:formate C-acetyltransferase/glycerol dehydratase family glycyl radical enzyme [Planctomycetota bacterium]